MKTIIIDSNIVLASLRSRDSILRKKIITTTQYRFTTVNFLFIEIFKYKEKIFKNARATEEEQLQFLNNVIQKIQFQQEEIISLHNFFEAYHLCKDIDKKDIPFVALSLELDAPLWTRDTILKEHLISKGFTNFFDESIL